MFKLKKLFENVWFAHKHLSKKAYTTGLICFSAVGIIAVMLIGVNGFASSKDVNHMMVYDVDEEDKVEQEETAKITEAVTSDESGSYYVEWAIDNYLVNTIPTVTLKKEDEEDRDLKTSGNLAEKETQTLSLKQYTALLRIVEAEATNEDLIGKIMIANVVLNRTKSKRFPNTIYSVVHQKYNGRSQFSPIDDGRYYEVTITPSTEEAVGQALSGVDYSDGALFFVAKSLASDSAGNWFDDHLTFVKQHGVHSFYKY